MSTELAWFKSSYSGGAGGDCIEVATGCSTVHVRDSKHTDGPQLSVHAAPWAAFVVYDSGH
ncbi:DUF397 domain-containing protein [Streptomyces syringium]|uniref:DUF397 domain-containing protein n=1 Tax=Streptomyces syringium TaxID=76729 RepID=A0ABS4Y6V9_9ACTN|nr:DUF397 domain-containing protein [Streptomyces syringium]MBP2404255.1 hypothetical protein [Streptomyces syringium]